MLYNQVHQRMSHVYGVCWAHDLAHYAHVHLGHNLVHQNVVSVPDDSQSHGDPDYCVMEELSDGLMDCLY